MTNVDASGIVRSLHGDGVRPTSDTPNMAKRIEKHLPSAHYAALRDASGWYLQAWRHKKNLTLEELAEEAGTSRGQVSDLETGAQKKDRPPTRFNRDWLDKMSKALGVTRGFLLDVNPFDANPDFLAMQERFEALDERGRQDALRLLDALKDRA